ncbi:MAG: oligosaccharide flippase family protein [Acidobacteriaceae bacterium]|nr:oligosaccharide flippase family protein [Acidobacteriaceae bacterium]
MSSRRVLIENITSLSALQLLNYAAPMATLPYLARVLGPEHLGLLTFAQGIVLYFACFTDFGFNFSQTRAIAACREARESVSQLFWSTIYAKTLLMCMSAVALSVLVRFVPAMRETPALYAVNFLYVIGTTFFPIWLFQGLEQLRLAAALFGSARLITIPALFLLVRQPHDYLLAAAIQASVEVIASIFAWPIILSRMRLTWYPPSVAQITHAFKQASLLFVSASAAQISGSATVVILGFTSVRAEVGYFSAADKLIRAAIAALNPVGQALYPHITVAKQRSPESAFQLIRQAFFVVLALSGSVSLIAALCARPLCHLILGKSFGHSITLLQLLSPLPLLYGLTSIFGTQTMLVFEKDRILSRILLISTVTGLPLTAALSLSFGAIGAAAGSVLTATLTVVVLWFSLHGMGMHYWQRPKRIAAELQQLSCAND